MLNAGSVTFKASLLYRVAIVETLPLAFLLVLYYWRERGNVTTPQGRAAEERPAYYIGYRASYGVAVVDRTEAANRKVISTSVVISG